jgi:glycosyltransferase involved in cell wall biosynthesis
MKILFLCYEHPAPEIAGSHRVLYSLEHLAGKYRHEITLLAFKLRGKSYPDLGRYARVEIVELERRPGFRAWWAAVKGALYMLNVFSGRPAFLNYGYSREMDARVKSLLSGGGYNVIAADHPAMLRYALGRGVPVVLLEAFAVAEIARLECRLETNYLKKALRFVYYLQTRDYARLYRRVDLLIAVSQQQREMVKAHEPALDIEFIPYGVDGGYLEAAGPEAEQPTLAITGSMSGPRNVATVLKFYRETYPLIKEKVPQVQLYIVGSSPADDINALAADPSVTVTGYVADMRPYLARAWVVVAPLLEGFGVKVRVLQAMAAGRPVVATAAVTGGIDASPGENIIIAKRPAEFAAKVIELITDRQLRERIGAAAKQLMAANHSWEKLTDRLNDVLARAAR